MRGYWQGMFGLDCERSIWVGQEDLGQERLIRHKNKRYKVKIPPTIDGNVTLRLEGLGNTRNNTTGDLLLHVWLNKGEDVRQSLWLSETLARDGAQKTLRLGERRIRVTIPAKSSDGLVIRLRGLGEKPDFAWRAPFLRRKRGNLLVKLHVFPDDVPPRYGSFDAMTTDDMALEGWVYRKIDDIAHRVGRPSFLMEPIKAGAVADTFNEGGWRAVFDALVRHLKLIHLNITVAESDAHSPPGYCQRLVAMKDNIPVAATYAITINRQFLDNPFSVAAIAAHELCHVVYSERIEDRSLGAYLKSQQASLEEERTVDLLVFMFKVGEFQLRVSRDQRLTFGYFNQPVFDRMQVIVSRKLSLHRGRS
jgi:hypothetical protein